MAVDRLKLASYNSTGLGRDKQVFIHNLLCNDIDILFLQEHWLHKPNLTELNNIHTNFSSVGASGMDSRKLGTVGRPYGGSAILFNKLLSDQIIPCKSEFKNTCGLLLNKLLLVCAYMPGDNHSQNNVSADFVDAVSSIESLLNANAHQSLIVGGDMNVDLSRDNAHTRYLKDFAARHQLCFIKHHQLAKFDVTYRQYMKNGTIRKSAVAHFIVSQDVFDCIMDIQCEEQRVDNPSGHTPLIIDVSVTDLVRHQYSPPSDSCKPSPTRIAWHKVKDTHLRLYHTSVTNALRFKQLPDALFCRDFNCTCVDHRSQLDDYTEFLVKTCIDSAENWMPKVKTGTDAKKGIPFWTENIAELREQALDCHWIWVNTGKPTSGGLFDEMRQSRRRYHYAIRQTKKNEDALRNQKLAESIANKRQGDIWKELKKANPTLNKKPSNIDKLFDDQDIVNHFAKKNKEIYNSVPSDKNVLKTLIEDISDKISASKDNERFCYNISQVIAAVQRSNINKSDGDMGFMSNHLKNGPHILFVHLSLICNAIIRHGYVPNVMLRGTITHIPKDISGKLSDSANYRGVCLCLCFSKILEDLIITDNSSFLQSSDLQFAYKKKHSTHTATLTLKELLRYYKLRKTRVFACALDASKAFDKVRHDKLYLILYDRGIPPVILRTVIDLYERQQSRCRYFTAFSDFYCISNGVRQGGVASPILFLVYMDELYKRLELSGHGLVIGNVYFGVIGYADDMLLVAANIQTLNAMLKICEEFGIEFDVAYNPTKSKFIIFNGQRMNGDGNAVMNGKIIPEFSEICYLGNILSSDLSDKRDIAEKRADLFSRTNSLRHQLGSLEKSIKCKLFIVKCAHSYGAETWDLGDKPCEMFWKALGQAARWSIGVPPSCPSTIVNTIFDKCVNRNNVLKKCLTLIDTFKTTSNGKMQVIYRNAINDQRSYMCSNLSFVLSEWKSLSEPPLIKDQSPTSVAVQELIEIREGSRQFDNFDHEDVDSLMMMMCER